jgi:hypothetical protein
MSVFVALSAYDFCLTLSDNPENFLINIFLFYGRGGSIYYIVNTMAQGRSQRVCPMCSCTPLGKKMIGGGYRTKELFTGFRIFSAGGHPP